MSVTELIEKHAEDHAHSSDPYFARAHLKHFAIELLELVDKGGIESIEGNEVDGYTVVHDYKVAIKNALEELRK